MIETTKLEAADYARLSSVGDGIAPPAGASIVVLANDHGEIVGRMFIVAVAHLEGTWVADVARGGIVAKRLMERVREEARGAGLTALMAYSASGEHDAYLHRLGFVRQPWTTWKLEIPCH